MKRYVSGLTLLAGCIAAWLTLQEDPPLISFETRQPVSVKETYIERGILWRYDQQGNREQTITVASATQFTDQPDLHMTDIFVASLDDSGQPWTLQAGAGRLQRAQKKLQLFDQVNVHAPHDDTTLTTPSLTMLLAEKQARGEDTVTLEATKSTTTAVGFTLDLKKGQARLLSNVEAVYEN